MKLQGIRGVSVKIRARGTDLPEYEDESADAELGDKASTYVECTPGSTFTVSTTVDERLLLKRNDVVCDIYLDGNYVNGKVFHRSAKGYPQHRRYDIVGRETNCNDVWMLERFRFSELKTNDESVHAVRKKDMARLGEIEVHFIRVEYLGRGQYQVNQKAQQTPAPSSVPEKALKGRAISSKATLSKPEPTAPLEGCRVNYCSGKAPFATFIFKYRTHKDLQAEYIIPRSPSPTPLEDRDPEDLSPEEARELVRRMRAAREKSVRVKQEIKREKRVHAQVIEDDGEEGEYRDDEEIMIASVTAARKRPKTFRDSGVPMIDLSED